MLGLARYRSRHLKVRRKELLLLSKELHRVQVFFFIFTLLSFNSLALAIILLLFLFSILPSESMLST